MATDQQLWLFAHAQSLSSWLGEVSIPRLVITNSNICQPQCTIPASKRRPANGTAVKAAYKANIGRDRSLMTASMWYHPTRVRLVFVLLIYCLVSTHVTSASLHFPQGCQTFNYSTQDQGTLQSVNCSQLGLQHVLDLNLSHTYANIFTDPATNLSTAGSPDSWYRTRLHYLDVSHNNVTSVQPDVDSGPWAVNVTIHVTELIFSFNNISHIQSGQLSTYTDVRHLDLSHNAINWLEDGAFTGQDSLQQLNLSHNCIQELTNSTLLLLQPLTGLRILDLSYNHIGVLSLRNLPELSSLKYLYLNNNQLHSVTSCLPLLPAASHNLPSLTFLDVSNNQIKQVSTGALQMLSSLRTLNVSHNSIQDFNEHVLMGLHALEELILDGNTFAAISRPIFRNTSLVRLSMANMANLCNISHDAFLGLTQLRYLNLSHNVQLTFLQPNLLTALKTLQTLDISSSGLQQLSQITFCQNSNLHHVFLLDNPLSCSCTNAWLATEAAHQNYSQFVDVESLVCLSGETGTPTHLSNASFSCEDISIHNVSSSPSSISAKLGSQLVLTCHHGSKDPAIITWSTPSGHKFYQHHFHPEASLHLLDPDDIRPGSEFHKDHYWHHTSSYHSELSTSETRVFLLSDGSLFIDYMLRADAGQYKCQVSNAHFNDTMIVNLFVECSIDSDIKIFGCIVGILCALTFFTLNLIYVVISWTARRLVNKRRRETIRQMLENLNAYKSTQIARIYENYNHQLTRVRNQYHIQRERLHKNYTCQVTRMKRGCSNQVEKVRDNYNNRLHQLRDYSTNQILQIRERANCQIARIRDYGTTQLDKLRETYKLQQQHVLKLLDTMNLDNCRTIVETECIRAESMMYDIDLLGDDDRTESPSSPADSEYSTAASSPSPSLDDPESVGLKRDMSHKQRQLSSGSSDNSRVIVDIQTTIDLERTVPTEAADVWEYLHIHDGHQDLSCTDKGDHTDSNLPATHDYSHNVSEGVPLPTVHLRQGTFSPDALTCSHKKSASDVNSDRLYMTPETSPTKVWPEMNSLSSEKPVSTVWPETTKKPSTQPSSPKVWPETRIPSTQPSPARSLPGRESLAESSPTRLLTFQGRDNRSQRNTQIHTTHFTDESDNGS